MLVTDGVTLNVHYSNEYSISKQYTSTLTTGPEIKLILRKVH